MRTNSNEFSQNLFHISEEPWLSRSIWSSINESIKEIANNLSSYCDYLDQQRKKASDRHQSPVPIRGSSEAEKFQIFNPNFPVKLAYVERYKAIHSVLKEASYFCPVFLNDLCPQDVRKRRYYLDCLSEGIDVHAVMFSHAYGNNLGTLHFIWRIPDETSPSELLDKNLKTAQSIQDRIGVFGRIVVLNQLIFVRSIND